MCVTMSCGGRLIASCFICKRSKDMLKFGQVKNTKRKKLKTYTSRTKKVFHFQRT